MGSVRAELTTALAETAASITELRGQLRRGVPGATSAHPRPAPAEPLRPSGFERVGGGGESGEYILVGSVDTPGQSTLLRRAPRTLQASQRAEDPDRPPLATPHVSRVAAPPPPPAQEQEEYGMASRDRAELEAAANARRAASGGGSGSAPGPGASQPQRKGAEVLSELGLQLPAAEVSARVLRGAQQAYRHGACDGIGEAIGQVDKRGSGYLDEQEFGHAVALMGMVSSWHTGSSLPLAALGGSSCCSCCCRPWLLTRMGRWVSGHDFQRQRRGDARDRFRCRRPRQP